MPKELIFYPNEYTFWIYFCRWVEQYIKKSFSGKKDLSDCHEKTIVDIEYYNAYFRTFEEVWVVTEFLRKSFYTLDFKKGFMLGKIKPYLR